MRVHGSVRNVLLEVIVVVALSARSLQAQNLFGVDQRAAAAQQAVVLAVQQGISSLPPTSGQAFSYRFAPELDTYIPSDVLGPISFRTASTVGRGNVTFRVATSYFDLNDTFGPIVYKVTGLDNKPLYTLFGTSVDAHVGLINLAATYGLLDRLELNFNVPLTIIGTSGSELFLGGPNGSEFPNDVRARDSVAAIYEGLADNSLEVRSISFEDRGVGNEFMEGTFAGVGRISMGGKYVFFSSQRFEAALMTELFLASPSEAEFSGSDTFAILPRIVTQTELSEIFRLHVDAGYDYDFSDAELRRFTWNVGASAALSRVTFDAGVGGSQFAKGIVWTPSQTTFQTPQGNTVTLTALGDNELGTTFVDFLAGVKLRLADRWVLGGAVNLPLNDVGLRAVAVGTIALEVRL